MTGDYCVTDQGECGSTDPVSFYHLFVVSQDLRK